MNPSSSNAKNIGSSTLIPEHRWLRPKHLDSFWEFYQSQAGFKVEEFGKSEENRSLRAIRWGSGPKRLLLWSQMHGNEPTATLAISDLLEELAQPRYAELAQELEIVFIPMLNPDGSERFQRRNALGIDLNRDALSQSSREMQAFFGFLERFNPHWAFNLHDQRNIFSAGQSLQTATLSFLAPSADQERTLTDLRKSTMQLIAGIHQHLKAMAPKNFGRYTDEFYPRALGDNLMKKGIPTLLFECGHYPGDMLRRKARSLSSTGILAAMTLIAADTWSEYSVEDYYQIPENGQQLRDLLFRQVQFEGRSFDLSLMLKEIPNFETDQLEQLYWLDDVGDLQHLQGIEEIPSANLVSYKEMRLEAPANFKMEVGQTEYLFKDGILRKH